MQARTLPTALSAILLLAACEARVGKETQSDVSQRSAEAKAEEGKFSIEAPGFGLKLSIPQALAERAEVDSDSGLLYPGSTLSGLHVEARDGAEGGRSGVELRFVSSDPPATVAAWYRDPVRARDFAVSSANETGGTWVISGAEREDGDPFEVTLGPRGGGTDGRLRLRDRT
jgi:hypothetical protein